MVGCHDMGALPFEIYGVPVYIFVRFLNDQALRFVVLNCLSVQGILTHKFLDLRVRGILS